LPGRQAAPNAFVKPQAETCTTNFPEQFTSSRVFEGK